jgi:hypothetical protein
MRKWRFLPRARARPLQPSSRPSRQSSGWHAAAHAMPRGLPGCHSRLCQSAVRAGRRRLGSRARRVRRASAAGLGWRAAWQHHSAARPGAHAARPDLKPAQPGGDAVTHSHVGRGARLAVLQDPNPSRGHLVYTAVSTTDVKCSAPGAASLASQRTRSAAAWPPGRGSRGEGRARALQPQGGGHGAGEGRQWTCS